MTPSRNTIGSNIVLAHGIVLARGIEKGARGIERLMVLFWLMVLKKGPMVLKAHGIEKGARGIE